MTTHNPTRGMPRLTPGPLTSLGYATGSLVTGAFTTVPGLLLLPYLTDTLGVAAALAGALVFLPKVCNVLLTPVAGRISDRTVTRFGPRLPFVLGAGLAVSVLFAAMFSAPAGGTVGVVWVSLGFLLATSAYAFFLAPYAAMPAEMTSDYGARTTMMSWRVAVLGIAILVSGSVAPALVTAGGNGLPGHRLMGLGLGIVIAIGALTVFLSTRRAPRAVSASTEPSLLRQLAVAVQHRPFRILVLAVALQLAATAALLAGVTYFALQVLRAPGATATLFLAVTAPVLVMLPVLARYGRRMNKRRGALVTSAVFVAASLALLAAPVSGMPLVLAAIAVLGLANSAQDTFVLAMLPDCIEDATASSGRRQAGVFAGLFSGAQALGSALGPLLFGVVLQLAGYLPSTTGVAAAQSADTATGVLIGFAVLPAALTVASMLVLWRYQRT